MERLQFENFQKIWRRQWCRINGSKPTWRALWCSPSPLLRSLLSSQHLRITMIKACSVCLHSFVSLSFFPPSLCHKPKDGEVHRGGYREEETGGAGQEAPENAERPKTILTDEQQLPEPQTSLKNIHPSTPAVHSSLDKDGLFFFYDGIANYEG